MEDDERERALRLPKPERVLPGRHLLVVGDKGRVGPQLLFAWRPDELVGVGDQVPQRHRPRRLQRDRACVKHLPLAERQGAHAEERRRRPRERRLPTVGLRPNGHPVWDRPLKVHSVGYGFLTLHQALTGPDGRDSMKEPYGRNEALKLVREICQHGKLSITAHARAEMAKDDMTSVDVMNILRCGKIADEPELEKGTYRYRIQTPKMMVVVALRSTTELVLVTAWRKNR
jgi:hypothetical protein